MTTVEFRLTSKSRKAAELSAKIHLDNLLGIGNWEITQLKITLAGNELGWHFDYYAKEI